MIITPQARIPEFLSQMCESGGKWKKNIMQKHKLKNRDFGGKSCKYPLVEQQIVAHVTDLRRSR